MTCRPNHDLQSTHLNVRQVRWLPDGRCRLVAFGWWYTALRRRNAGDYNATP